MAPLRTKEEMRGSSTSTVTRHTSESLPQRISFFEVEIGKPNVSTIIQLRLHLE